MYFKRLFVNIRKSLQWKLVFIFISIALFLMIFVYAFLNTSVNSFYYTSFVNQIEKGFNDWTTIGQNPTADEIVRQFKEKRSDVYFFLTSVHLSVTVIDQNTKQIIYSTDPKFNTEKNANNEEFLNQIYSSANFVKIQAGNDKGAENKLNHMDGRDYFDYARKKGDFIFYFIYDKEAWRSITESFNSMIFNVSLFAILASLVIGYIISKTITAPVVNIMHKAQKVAEGEFDHVLDVRSDDEIGKLTKTFNYMAKELKNTLAEISSEKNKIETILNYMTDGVIAFNLKGDIIHANPASRKLLGITDDSITFNDLSKKCGFGISLEDILYFGASAGREKDVNCENRAIRAYFAVFTDETKKVEGIITVLQDITEQQKLDRMRREFVANVSHELRTPITSIKSYTETLLDGAIEDRETSKRFLGVINSESDRMTRLVKDLLQLSRLDNQQMQWNMKEVCFEDVVIGCIGSVSIEAQNKNQIMEKYVIGDIPKIIADKDRIEQVVLNILTNAIKYTHEGGKITVYIGKLYSDVYMKVVDTGIGIPNEDLPRLFERFYRVDKARSREMGGTGLGLSIAKEIVEAHGGSISISSELDKGTEVMVRLPVENIAASGNGN